MNHSTDELGQSNLQLCNPNIWLKWWGHSLERFAKAKGIESESNPFTNAADFFILYSRIDKSLFDWENVARQFPRYFSG